MNVRSAPVVVGYDGSEHAGMAVDWAANEAVRRGCPLTVLFTTDFTGLFPGLTVDAGGTAEHAQASFQSIADEGVDRARQVSTDLEVTGRAELSTAAGALVRASRSAALIVVGTRGHGALAGALLGSVAFQVTAHALCPVVVVRGDSIAPAGPTRPVVVGVDGSPGADAALSFAGTLAAQTGAPLHLVSAWQPLAGDSVIGAYWESVEPGVSPKDAATRVANVVVDRAKETVLRANPDLTVTTSTVQGRAGEALAHASRDAGLTVVGARGRGGFASLLLGSVSRAVIHSAASPVAVVRETSRSK